MYPVVKQSTILSRKLNGKPYDTSKVRKKPLLAVTFDDGIDTDFTRAFPYMTERGVKGTSYLITSRVGTDRRLSWDNIHEMKSGGMCDFQCHSYNHIRMTEATEQEIRQNLEDANDAFTSNGLEIPKHFAYPYGAFNDFAQNIVADYRETQRI